MITDIDFIQDIQGFLMEQNAHQMILLVDGNIHKLYEPLLDEFDLIVVPPGEFSKNISLIEELSGMLVDSGCQRDSLLVGIGGGVVTDIAGFIASVYMRGMSFGLVPTTLLGMCDAAIGGKNGVNAGGIKNILGTIRQADFIAVYTGFLNTLPGDEFRNGMAEVIKHAFISGKEFMAFLSEHADEIKNKQPEILKTMIRMSADVKRSLVIQDEQDQGQRHLLNFGHTIAHALEPINGRSHGECVAAGMYIDALIANKMGLCDLQTLESLGHLISLFDLPQFMPFKTSQLMEKILGDKKRRKNVIRYILPAAPGDCRIINIDDAQFSKYLNILEHE